MLLYLNLFFKNRKYEGKYNLNNKKFHPIKHVSLSYSKIRKLFKTEILKFNLNDL